MAALLHAAAVQALEQGLTIRVTYSSGFTHRLRLEPPRETVAAAQEPQDVAALVRELVRRPADVMAAADVLGAERLLADMARKNGVTRVWTDEGAALHWLLR
jgi:N-methylhydantoinase B/oxoprolinase/acetone carboxylase alpha subunit